MNTPLNTPNDTIVMIVSFFCTGLGCALALTGVLFWVMFFVLIQSLQKHIDKHLCIIYTTDRYTSI